MFLVSLLLLPFLGVLAILTNTYKVERMLGDVTNTVNNYNNVPQAGNDIFFVYSKNENTKARKIGLLVSLINLIISLVIFIIYDFSSNHFQFVEEIHQLSYFYLCLGIDGVSIYFIILTTIITPICLLSNWVSISKNARSYVIIILLLEALLLTVFLVLDSLLFYIFFESILPPLFLLIGLFGSNNKVRASFYLFLYTLLGSLFLLISILSMLCYMGSTNFNALFKTSFDFDTQLFLFCGIFIAFAVKTPTIFLNTWLLKAHVESPLGGSILLAGYYICLISSLYWE